MRQTLNLKNTLLLFLTAIAFISCKKEDEIVPFKENRDFADLSLIGQGSLYGNGDEGFTQQNIVISNEEDWTDFINSVDSYNEVSSSFSETDIDFDLYDVFAIMDQVRSSGGYAVSIDTVYETSEDVIVDVLASTPEGLVTTVITQPYYIAKYPKSGKTILFE